MLLLNFFIFLQSILLFGPVSSSSSDSPEFTWRCLCSKFYKLNRLDENRRQVLLKDYSFRKDVDDFQKQIQIFFSNHTKEAFIALERSSKDTGLFLFFFRVLFRCIVYELGRYHEIFFSFDSFLLKNPITGQISLKIHSDTVSGILKTTKRVKYS
jgi:hypothetical protein